MLVVDEGVERLEGPAVVVVTLLAGAGFATVGDEPVVVVDEALVGAVLLLARDNAAVAVEEGLAVLVRGLAPPAHAVKPRAAAALSNTREKSGR